MSQTSFEQPSDINLAKYRQYAFTQRRVSEWVQQTRPHNARPLYSRLEDRKQANTHGGRRSRTSQKSKGRQSGTHGYNNRSRIELSVEKMPISPVVALVSSSLMVWAFDLLPSIMGIFGFAFLLNLATISRDEKVRIHSAHGAITIIEKEPEREGILDVLVAASGSLRKFQCDDDIRTFYLRLQCAYDNQFPHTGE